MSQTSALNCKGWPAIGKPVLSACPEAASWVVCILLALRKNHRLLATLVIGPTRNKRCCTGIFSAAKPAPPPLCSPVRASRAHFWSLTARLPLLALLGFWDDCFERNGCLTWQSQHRHHYVRPFARSRLPRSLLIAHCAAVDVGFVGVWADCFERNGCLTWQSQHRHHCVRPFAPPALTFDRSLRGCRCWLCWGLGMAAWV